MNKGSIKKKQKLGMSHGTAYHRLMKDIIFNFVVTTGRNVCFRCGGEMTRDDFSIEHKEAWLNSHSPVQKYFDLNNISFSHIRCNSKEASERNRSSSDRKNEIRLRANARRKGHIRKLREADPQYGR